MTKHNSCIQENLNAEKRFYDEYLRDIALYPLAAPVIDNHATAISLFGLFFMQYIVFNLETCQLNAA